MISFFVVILCALITWFFVDGIRVREMAIAIGKRACERHDVQFLDGSAALSRVGLRRDGGTLKILRTYQFEFSDSGDNRRKAYISMLGAQLFLMRMNLENAEQ